jgi:predicted RNase H-like HicB family nuclease
MAPFRYRVVVAWSDEENTYVARVPALAGCVARADVAGKAVQDVISAAQSVLEVMREDGERIPAEDIPSARRP